MFSTLIATLLTTFQPAARSEQPINEIRKIFYQIPAVNAQRDTMGLNPVINLSIGQPHCAMQTEVFDPFIAYVEELKSLPPDLLSKEMGYTHSAGTKETRESISRFYTECFPEVAEGFKPEEVMVTCGATGALNNILKVTLEEGDAAVVFSPYFAPYRNQIKLCGGLLIPVPIIPGRPREEVLDEVLAGHPEVKVLIWNDPANPTGAKAGRKEMEALAAVLSKHPNLLIIHDEVYRDMTFENPYSLINAAPELKKRSFIIRSLAKDILGAPGIRAGMVSAPTEVFTPDGVRIDFIELMSNIQLLEVTSVSVLVQKILCIALEQKLSGAASFWEQKMLQEYEENSSLVADAFARMGLPPLTLPGGTFYVMIDASPLLGVAGIQSDLDAALFFLKKAGVAIVPCSGFDAGCCLRISCARPKKDLLQALYQIQVALAEETACLCN